MCLWGVCPAIVAAHLPRSTGGSRAYRGKQRSAGDRRLGELMALQAARVGKAKGTAGRGLLKKGGVRVLAHPMDC